MSIRYSADYSGTRELMNSEQMTEVMHAKGELARAFAEGIAPVGGKGDPHPGEYKESFEVSAAPDGGFHGDRAEAQLRNNAGHAVDVEWKDGHHVLTRTLGALGNL